MVVEAGRVRETITQQAAATKQSAVEALQQARAAVFAAQAAVQQGQQQAEAAWQELGDVVVQARQGAMEALQSEPEALEVESEQGPLGEEGVDMMRETVQQALQALQQASYQVPEEQPGLRAALQAVQQPLRQMLRLPQLWRSKQQAMESMQPMMQAAMQEASSEAMSSLQGTSQASQVLHVALHDQQRELFGMQILVRGMHMFQQSLHQDLLAAAAAGGPGMDAAVVATQAASQELTAVREALGRVLLMKLQLKQHVQRVMLQAAGRQLLAGRPQVDKSSQWLKAEMQAWARDLKHDAQALLNECVKAGVRLLQRADGNVSVLQAAVQAGQALLQSLEG